MKRTCFAMLLPAISLSVLVGCAGNMTVEQMKEMRPQRPAELDRLNQFVGTWRGEGTATMMGVEEPMTSTGTSTTGWEVDGWYLVERGEYEMGEFGGMKGIGIWTYDPSAKKYRTWWFDNFGGNGFGSMKYNEKTNIWKMSMRGHSPMGSTRGRGTIEFVDDNTMKWHWEEWPAWDWLGLFRIMEFNGTSTRQ